MLTVDLAGLARRYAAADLPFGPRFDPNRRWYRRLAAAADHEAWVLTWLPGQGTDLHDHGGSAGAFTVLSGSLVEEVPSGGSLRLRLLVPGQVRGFGPRHIHRVVNRGPVAAISVHVYGPALKAMNTYLLGPEGPRRVAMSRAGADW